MVEWKESYNLGFECCFGHQLVNHGIGEVFLWASVFFSGNGNKKTYLADLLQKCSMSFPEPPIKEPTCTLAQSLELRVEASQEVDS